MLWEYTEAMVIIAKESIKIGINLSDITLFSINYYLKYVFSMIFCQKSLGHHQFQNIFCEPSSQVRIHFPPLVSNILQVKHCDAEFSLILSPLYIYFAINRGINTKTKWHRRKYSCNVFKNQFRLIIYRDEHWGKSKDLNELEDYFWYLKYTKWVS